MHVYYSLASTKNIWIKISDPSPELFILKNYGENT